MARKKKMNMQKYSLPSPRANAESTKNGADFPIYSYIAPPNGGPMRTPRANPPSAIPIALPRSLSSWYLSANIPIPVNESHDRSKFEQNEVQQIFF